VNSVSADASRAGNANKTVEATIAVVSHTAAILETARADQQVLSIDLSPEFTMTTMSRTLEPRGAAHAK